MMIRRAVLGLIGSLLLLVPAGAIAAGDRPQILFVCQYGSVKSAIARELLRREAAKDGLKVTVGSRGITPGAHLPPALRDRLAAEGIDPGAEPLRQLTQADLDRADVVVVFDKLPPSLVAPKAEDWSDLGSILNDYSTTRPELDRRIAALLQRLRH